MCKAVGMVEHEDSVQEAMVDPVETVEQKTKTGCSAYHWPGHELWVVTTLTQDPV